jgi:putative transposase
MNDFRAVKKWRDRPPAPGQARRPEVADAVWTIFDNSGGTYCSPQVTQDLWAAGWRVSEGTVVKLMAELGLAASPKRRHSVTRRGKGKAALDRMQSALHARLWPFDVALLGGAFN